MKVTKKVVGKQRDWIKVKEDINEGDTIGIVGTGEWIPSDFGDKKKRLVFTVETKNGEKDMTFNQTTINYLIDAFGDDTDDWIGQTVKVWVTRSMIGDKMRNVVYLTAPDWVENEDGFAPPTISVASKPIKDEDIPIIEEEGIENEG